MSRGKIVLLSLPVATVAVVGFALLVVGAPRAYYGARVFGGTVDGAPYLSLRIAIVEHYAGIERPAPIGDFVVEALFSDGRRAAQGATTDARGMAEVTLTAGPLPVRGPVRLAVARRGRGAPRLAAGAIALSSEEWTARARLRGGWVGGAKSGTLTIRVAPERGVFAVPFVDPMLIEVRRGGAPLSGAKLELEPEGLQIVTVAPLSTGADGRVSCRIAPKEHVASLRVVATAAGERGEWSGVIPVAPGALHAVREGNELLIESPIDRDVVHYAVITERVRLSGGPLALVADESGAAKSRVRLPSLPPGPIWAVVSSDPELESPSTIGWPIGETNALDGEPMLARAVPDRLLLDGLEIGRAAEAARRRSARAIALGFSLLAALLAAILLGREARRSSVRLETHLAEAGTGEEETKSIAERPTRFVSVLIALLCVAMGFLVVALVSLHRIE